MRAIFYPFDMTPSSATIQLEEEAAHHLIVARVKIEDEVLLLNGYGDRLQTVVASINKKIVCLRTISHQKTAPLHEISLAVATPKKDAFEDILKISVELGVKNIYPLTSRYSQYEYVESQRVQRVLESALIQSNNSYFPIICPQQTLNVFLKNHQEELMFLNSIEYNLKKVSTEHRGKSTKKTILIGPEGGFSSEEVDEIRNYFLVDEVHLTTPILRSPTAVAASVGYLLASLQ